MDTTHQNHMQPKRMADGLRNYGQEQQPKKTQNNQIMQELLRRQQKAQSPEEKRYYDESINKLMPLMVQP